MLNPKLYTNFKQATPYVFLNYVITCWNLELQSTRMILEIGMGCIYKPNISFYIVFA